MTSHPPFERVAIIGLGLIGSSLARGLHASGIAPFISASDRNLLALQYGVEHGFIQHAAEQMEQAVENADLVILATPPSALAGVAESIGDHLRKGAIVTDTASVKVAAIAALQGALPEHIVYVPGHPIAGSEQSGVKAGKADLFSGRRVTLTPLTPENPGLPAVTQLWQALGATVEYMPPDVHDRVYAYVSHLPQWLAFSLRPLLEPYLSMREQHPAFKRFTRLCYSDTTLWRDIFEANKTNIEQALARYLLVLQQIRGELAEGMPPEAAPESDEAQAEIYLSALPRIIASCLIASVYQEERTSGFSFSRYAGTGFADFTAPAQEEPDKHLEFISNHPKLMVDAIDAALRAITRQIVTKD